MLINNSVYCTRTTESYRGFIFRKLTDFDHFDIMRDADMGGYFIETVYKINAKFYLYEAYLRKYIPYAIQTDEEKNYCILNRDDEYIGLNVKEFNENEKYKSYRLGRKYVTARPLSYDIYYEYIFDDDTAPWRNKQYLKEISDKYEKIIKEKNLKVCLNINEFTLDILSWSKSL